MKPNHTKPMSYKEIGKVLGLCGESVRQIEKKALRKLRNQGKLKEFLILLDDKEDYFGE